MDLPGEKVFIKLIETIEKGVGGALKPWQIKRVEGAYAEARIKERILLEKFDQDIIDVKSGRSHINAKGVLVRNNIQTPLSLVGPDQTTEPSTIGKLELSKGFASAAKDSNDAQVLQQCVNLKRIALFAEEDAERIDIDRGEPTPTEGSAQGVDEDWFTKWRVNAQNVGREEMQRLWGRLLTNEVALPGSFSLHTIDFLSRLSNVDVQLISKLAPFHTSLGIIDCTDDYFRENGLAYIDFMELNDLGIINGLGQTDRPDASPELRNRGDLKVSHITCNSTVLEIEFVPQRNEEARFTVYPVTKVGREILSLAQFPPNDSYLQLIAEKAIKLDAENVRKFDINFDGTQISKMQLLASNPRRQSTADN